ncbi:hypothetical protein AMATHDRAFT_60585, partial [Amanita thiersii Skay4041]
MFLFKFRRREDPWEVVDSKVVDPIPMFDDEDDIDIDVISDVDMVGTYVFDVKKWGGSVEVPKALMFARQQLLQYIPKKGYNILLQEGWCVTVFRRCKQHRVEVRYVG